jgi:predicted hotdog family 3-hydroxylacyl-ACP dehydratase
VSAPSTVPYPPVAGLLPHAGRWVLLSGVVEHVSRRTTCRLTVDGEFPFAARDGRVPALLGLEYMAQCIAVHGALSAEAGEEPIRAGLLLGSRRLEVRTPGFLPGQPLEVTAERVWGDTSFFVFECAVRDEATSAVLMDGSLMVYRLPEGAADPRRPGVAAGGDAAAPGGAA